MKKMNWLLISILAGLVFSQSLAARQLEVDSLTVPFSKPSQPKDLQVSLIMGSIYVNGYSGQDVRIKAQARASKRERSQEKNGMRLIPNTSTGLVVEEDNNSMTVGTSSWARAIDITIDVPRNTSLKLATTNNGVIEVDNIEGEIEANNSNGSIKLTRISGAAIAYSANGRVEVSFDRVTPEKTMSFITMNGTIDVTFPANIKADVKMRTDNGNVYSDFDVEMQRNVRKVEKSDRNQGSKYRVTLDKDMYGKINGGGPEFQFRTLNGSIYIRERK